MDASADFDDLSSDGVTPRFDGSDPPEANDLPQPPHKTTIAADVPQQHTIDGEQDEQGHNQQPRLLMQHEWDGTTEPSSDTLRYTGELKAVMNTERIGTNTDKGVFLHPGVLDALSRELAPQDRPDPCSNFVVVSVSKRAERDLTKEFIGQDIDWLVIAEKLES